MYKEIEDFRKEMQVLKRYESILWAIKFHIHTIVQEEDVEMVINLFPNNFNNNCWFMLFINIDSFCH